MLLCTFCFHWLNIRIKKAVKNAFLPQPQLLRPKVWTSHLKVCQMLSFVWFHQLMHEHLSLTRRIKESVQTNSPCCSPFLKSSCVSQILTCYRGLSEFISFVLACNCSQEEKKQPWNTKTNKIPGINSICTWHWGHTSVCVNSQETF